MNSNTFIFIKLAYLSAKVCRKLPLSLLDPTAEEPYYILSMALGLSSRSLSQRYTDHEANMVSRKL